MNMKQITIKSYAKINLSLDVLGLLPNGYHQVEMMMQQVELHDLVTIGWEPKEAGCREIQLTANGSNIPLNKDNIAYKGAELIMEQMQQWGRVEIHIEKNIPVAAGLAGGSGNGAAVLHGLNFLLGLRLSVEALCNMGVGLGADVPFCIMGQAKGNPHLGKEINKDPLSCTCALAEGIGEILTPWKALDAWILLSKPPIGISTAEVYQGIDKEMGFIKGEEGVFQHHIHTKALMDALKEKKYEKITSNMANILELFSLKRYPVIVYTKHMIEQEGRAIKTLMSGSGPTVFSVYLEKSKAEADYDKLHKHNVETYITRTLI